MTFSIGTRLIGRSVRDDLPESIMPNPPKLGLVIGTYGALAYIRLQLEAHKRMCPHIPMLVHDDASPERRQLAEMCAGFGVEFESNSYHMPYRGLGDLTAFLGGLLWAHDKGVDLLVKFSRRFVPLLPWHQDLEALAIESEGATYSHSCISNGWGFRTECMAMHVQTWINFKLADDMKEKILKHDEQFVEGYMHGLANRAIAKTSLKNCLYLDDYPGHVGLGFIPWRFMGVGRNIPDPHALWHNRNPPADYLAQAQAWGITQHTLEDFAAVKTGT